MWSSAAAPRSVDPGITQGLRGIRALEPECADDAPISQPHVPGAEYQYIRMQ
jgi:hypothetical protein